MTDAPVLYRAADGVAHIELNRPSLGNSVDIVASNALFDAVERAGRDNDVRVVLVSGAGPRFCTGGDVMSMIAAEDRPLYLNALATAADAALQLLDRLDKPVVSAVQGAAAGAGLALALSTDLVVAERSAKFLTAYAGIGATPDCGLSWLLPRAIGQQRALELMLTGRVLSGDEAVAWGIATRVVEDGTALDAARALADQLAAGPSPALGWSRRLVRSSWESSRALTGREEARTIALASGTAASVERVDAFARKGR